jgi:MFS family permease
MAIISTSNQSIDKSEAYPVKRGYAWVVFALIFGLMMSDYLSRQVINAVFPFLKVDWQLSDAQLGSLVSVVALTVGFLCVPFAMLADRYGRVKGITLMAMVWALATIACGYSGNFLALFIARTFVGLGEAGYGSAGAAILVRVFPVRLHATVTGSFLAAAIFGSMAGIILGGVIAQSLGWHMAFIIIGLFGVALAVVFPFIVKEPAKAKTEVTEKVSIKSSLRDLFSKRVVILCYLGAGTASFLTGSLLTWIPSYLNRYFGMDPAQAAKMAGVMILLSGIGMVFGGAVVDKISRGDSRKRLLSLMGFGILAAATLVVAFSLPHNQMHLALMAIGMTLGSAYSGPTIAVIARIVSPSIHATAFALVTLSMSMLGLAPGPFVIGWLADQSSLNHALYAVPVMCLVSAAMYFLAARACPPTSD